MPEYTREDFSGVTREMHDQAATAMAKILAQCLQDAEALGRRAFDLKLEWFDNPFLTGGDTRLLRRWYYGWDQRRVEVFRERNEKLFV